MSNSSPNAEINSLSFLDEDETYNTISNIPQVYYKDRNEPDSNYTKSDEEKCTNENLITDYNIIEIKKEISSDDEYEVENKMNNIIYFNTSYDIQVKQEVNSNCDILDDTELDCDIKIKEEPNWDNDILLESDYCDDDIDSNTKINVEIKNEPNLNYGVLDELKFGDDETVVFYVPSYDDNNRSIKGEYDKVGVNPTLQFVNNTKCSSVRKKNLKEVFKCDKCLKEFSVRKHFVYHTRTHMTEQLLKCPICHKGFVQLRKLKFHTKSKHDFVTIVEDTQKYKCEICNKTFAKKSYAEVHERRVHLNEKPFKCNLCTKAYSHRCDLTVHMRTHTNEKPFTCHICSKSFIQSSKLNRHIPIHFKCKKKKTDKTRRK